MNTTLLCISHTIAVLLGYILGALVSGRVLHRVQQEESREMLEKIWLQK